MYLASRLHARFGSPLTATIEERFRHIRQSVDGLVKADGPVFVLAYLLNFAVYAYLFTGFPFTNHTTQNAFVQPYPSYRTIWEGRWLHDIIIQVSGGFGTQSLQMFVGVALQITSGIVFAHILGARRRSEILMVALLVSLHPLVADYYSFNSDAISFTLGDLLIAMGCYALLRPGYARIVIATILFFLSLSIYQPKISLLIVILLIACRRSMLDVPSPVSGFGNSLRRVVFIAVRFFLPAVLACFAYWLSLKAVVSRLNGPMTLLDVGKSPLARIEAAYAHALASVYDLMQLLFFPLSSVVLLAVVGGVGAAVVICLRRPSLERVIGLVILPSLPVGIYLAYILNDTAWSVAGRLVVAEAYTLAFLLSLAWPYPVLRQLSILAAVGLIYVFIIIGAQESQATNLRSTLELQRADRILARIEAEVPDLYSRKHDLLIVGRLPTAAYRQFVKFPWRANRPNISFSLFATYHQVDYLNLLAGTDVFERVQAVNLDALLNAATAHAVWPAPGSVFVANDTIVVNLESYKDGIEKTDQR